MSDSQGIRVKSSGWFKLRRQAGKHYVAVKLLEGFGFVPEMIIVERDTTRSNVIRVNAVLTEAEIKKEDERREALAKLSEDTKKQLEVKKKDEPKPTTN